MTASVEGPDLGELARLEAAATEQLAPPLRSGVDGTGEVEAEAAS